MKSFIIGEDNLYQEISDYKNAQWLHFESPLEDEIHFLTDELGIPQDFITDAFDYYEVPRQEVAETKFGDKILLLLVLYPHTKEAFDTYRSYETLPLAIILIHNKIITVCSSDVPFLERVYTNQLDKDWYGSHIVLDILWELTDSYLEKISDIDKTIDDMEQNIVDTTRNEAFYKLIAIHKNLVYFETGILENHRIIKNLMDRDIYSEDAKGKTLLHDIKVISHQASIMVKESAEMIDHLSEVFSSVISNNLNNIMKFLTSFSIVLTIPTIIGSFWGMNVFLPIEKHPLAFIFLIGLSILISVVTFLWLKRKDYM
ncbi:MULTISPECIES: magnesium transporter CorA family protein [unclassified Jeotgalibaca]|uniref:magnesium transporter CorA family protein n=1 Tax=unclassified Jeotgalibaca TaxID=2621505 RepID=UPI003FD3789E